MAYAAALVMAVATAAGAQPRYAVQSIGVMDGFTACVPSGMNDRGDVVGMCTSIADGSFTGFAWRNGVMTSTGKLAKGTYSVATAINNAGFVVGDGDTGNGRPQGWYQGAKGPVLILKNNGGNTHLVAVNDAGTIGGYYTKSLSGNTDSWKGVVFTYNARKAKYTIADMPFLPSADGTNGNAVPMAFNQAGQAAGSAYNSDIGQHAAFWHNNAAHTIVDLGNFGDDWSSHAEAISDSGEVAGTSHPPFGARPVVWGNDAAHTPRELPTLPGDNYGYAYAINRLGHVLGTSYYGVPSSWDANPARYVLWRDGGVFELSTIADPVSSPGWTIDSAIAINNAGQIAGVGSIGGVSYGVVLTPIQ